MSEQGLIELFHLSGYSVDYSFDEFKKIKGFLLSNTNLDSLPDSFSNLINLKEVYAYYNKLTSLPDSIGDITNLEVLNVSNNNLVSLPASIGNLKHLRNLYLSNNQLSFLPASICDLIKKNKVNLRCSNNHFFRVKIGKLFYEVLSPDCLYYDENNIITPSPDELFSNLRESNPVEQVIDFYSHFSLDLGQAVSLVGGLSGFDSEMTIGFLECLKMRLVIDESLSKVNLEEYLNLNRVYDDLISGLLNQQSKLPYLIKVFNSCYELKNLISYGLLRELDGYSKNQVITKSNEALKQGVWL